MLDLDPGARRLGELGLGLNHGIDRFTGSILYDEKIGGTVHLALGQSYPETGGVNDSALHWDLIVDTRTAGPDHGRRPARHGKRSVAGGLIEHLSVLQTRRLRQCDATQTTALTLPLPRWPPVLLLVTSSSSGRRAQAAATDAALRDRVLQLVDRLDAPTAGGPRRRDRQPDQARPQGPAAPARPGHGQDRRAQGPARARPRGPATKEDEINTDASHVTIDGKGIRLSEALQQLQKQTGNAITDMREQLGAEVTNPALDLDVRDKPFFEALDRDRAAGRSLGNIFDRRRLDRHHGRRARPTQPPTRPPANAKRLIQYSRAVPHRAQAIEPVARLPAGTGGRHLQIRGGLGAAAPARCS